jgi:hypothetical protein
MECGAFTAYALRENVTFAMPSFTSGSVGFCGARFSAPATASWFPTRRPLSASTLHPINDRIPSPANHRRKNAPGL